jgi:hypothetical protein
MEIPTLREDNGFVSNILTRTFTDTPSSPDQPGSGMFYQTLWHQQSQWMTSRPALTDCQRPRQELLTAEPRIRPLYIVLTCCIYVWLSFLNICGDLASRLSEPESEDENEDTIDKYGTFFLATDYQRLLLIHR